MHLILGEDNTGKSTIALRVASRMITKKLLTREDILIIDWDGTAQKVAEDNYSLSVFKPDFILDDKHHLDYLQKFVSVLSKVQEKKWKLIIFDGASGFLGDCELLMRIDHTLEIDDTVRFRFWTTRNQFFLNMMDMCLIYGENLIIVGHGNLKLTGDKDAKLKITLNARAISRLETLQSEKEGKIIFAYKVTKSKNALFYTNKAFANFIVNVEEEKIELKGGDKIDKIFKI